MMPLAPIMSLPSIGHMTAATTSTTNQSKPKLTFSIDSIVGCNTNDNKNKTHDNHNSSKANQRSKLSPLDLIHTSLQPLSQTKYQIRNTSPLSTTSPIIPNVMKSNPYLEQNGHHSHRQQSNHLNQHMMTGGPPPPHPAMSHPLMMAAAQHMPVPQDYHHAVALYPWLLRANPFANRFHGMPFDGSFLLPPFRKPKRIRTAFSPGQLLKLEQAFEKNHYVVGTERKQLANNLGLSETQVKVWFQNRRTKHKRQKQEDEHQTGCGSNSDNQSNCAKDNRLSDDDEDIDEDIDLNDEDMESDNDMIENDIRSQIWFQSMQPSISQNSPSIASTSASLKT